MIYFITALSFEAQPLISSYNMKCAVADGPFRIYESEDAILGISGSGEFSAATLAGALFTFRKPGDCDVLINYGIAGAVSTNLHIGELLLANEIRCEGERNIYTDVFFGGGLKTCAIPRDVVDMEAYAISFAGSKYFSADRIFILKVISDIASETTNNKMKIDRALATKVISENAEKVVRFANGAAEYYKQNDLSLTDEENKLFEKTAENWMLTFQGRTILRNFFTKQKLLGKIISYECEPVKDKRQGEIKLKKLVAGDD